MQKQDRRWCIEALRDWVDNYDFQLKFVVASENDVVEIHELLSLIDRKIAPERIMLMPEGSDLSVLQQRDTLLLELVWTLPPR